MKVAILSKADRSGGGASRCAEDLVAQFRHHNHHADHFARSSRYEETLPLYTQNEKKIYHRLLSLGLQELIPFEKKVIRQHDEQHHYDLFHFHDLSTAISPLTLKWLSDHHRPVIWTLHDCSPVTGGCINPLGCDKYQTHCFPCPQINTLPLGKNLDLSFLFRKLKAYVHHKSHIHYVAPSKWLADFVYDTGLLDRYPTIIPNGVDTRLFCAHDKHAIRQALSLPEDRFVILLSSAAKNNPFKGLYFAINVIDKLRELNPFILVVGEKDPALLGRLTTFDYRCTGFIADREVLGKYYSAADIYLNTTIAEVQSIASLEAMSSQTPVFGFKTGGVPELITQGEDGVLVDNRDTGALAHHIITAYRSGHLSVMGQNARKKVEDNYSMELLFQRYLQLYRDVINGIR
ncbi:glycosyltransferase [Aeromonas enteropelogenes]|uniref:glycosyltransferase n=1 Tax=Aeromonas enteropelogenes TaxID=29489 RepID=UPI0016281C2F|nr:glycosyltransferase [Aeromonas enteropelogenes]